MKKLSCLSILNKQKSIKQSPLAMNTFAFWFCFKHFVVVVAGVGGIATIGRSVGGRKSCAKSHDDDATCLGSNCSKTWMPIGL